MRCGTLFHVALCSEGWILEVAPTVYGVALSSIKQDRIPVNIIISRSSVSCLVLKDSMTRW